MKRTKKFIVGLLIALYSFVMLFGFSGCSSTHITICSTHMKTLQYTKYEHWQECEKCGKELSSREKHSLTQKYNEDMHWDECSCGYKQGYSHSFSEKHNQETHWQQCHCGYKAGVTEHTFVKDICSSCGYELSFTQEEYMAKCSANYTYDMLARYPDKYYNDYVHLIGEVVEIYRSGNTIKMRVAITKKGSYYTDDIWVVYTKKSDENFLEDDIIQFYGRCKGDFTYTTVLGASRTIPQVNAEYIILVSGMFD